MGHAAGMMIAAALGVCTWSFLEYVIHRWLGHHPRTRGNLFGVEHVRHHAEGNYFAAAKKKLAAAVLVAALVVVPVSFAVGAVGAAWGAGLLGMYLAYELVHYRDHIDAGWTGYGRRMRRHHFFHHFEDPRSNFGVTSPVWDWVFGTYRTPTHIHVPAKLAMRWLPDPTTGDARTAYQTHYTIRRRAV